LAPSHVPALATAHQEGGREGEREQQKAEAVSTCSLLPVFGISVNDIHEDEDEDEDEGGW